LFSRKILFATLINIHSLFYWNILYLGYLIDEIEICSRRS